MRSIVLAALLLIAGCSREPSFDEQYSAAEQSIGSEAAAIDQALASASPEPSGTIGAN